MACLQHNIVLLLIAMLPTIIWSNGLALEQSESHQKSNSELRPDIPSSRVNVRSIGEQHGGKIEKRSSIRDQNGSYKILNGHSKDNIKANRRGQLQEPSLQDKVVFPGPTAASSTQRFMPEINEECKREGICERIMNYPDDYIKTIIAQLDNSENKFYTDESYVPDTPDIAQRLGPQEDNMELCTFKEKVMYPEALPDSFGEWHMVVNPKSKPVQGFKVEICESNKSSCADFVTFQSGYKSQCIQKYAQRRMQVLDEEGHMVEKSLKVPSCCSCVAKLIL